MNCSISFYKCQMFQVSKDASGKANRMIETFIKTRSATEVYSVCVYDWGCYDYEIVVGQKVQIKFQVNEQFQTLAINGAEVLTRSETHNELLNASIFAGKTRRTEYSWVGKVTIENLHVKADSNCKGKRYSY